MHPDTTLIQPYQAEQVANPLLPGIGLYGTRKAQSGRLGEQTLAGYLPLELTIESHVSGSSEVDILYALDLARTTTWPAPAHMKAASAPGEHLPV